VISRDFEALVLVEVNEMHTLDPTPEVNEQQTLRRTFELRKCNPLDLKIVATVSPSNIKPFKTISDVHTDIPECS
jgi:hypothetical protein